ncbi:hypothetical protein [Paraburkholderia azotifigens]|uniref:Uncharacterized protein n=1 Tax=Paraburkholderia azotifigens TaxID=2057004 RepID=A0ABU9QZS7_9BURK
MPKDSDNLFHSMSEKARSYLKRMLRNLRCIVLERAANNAQSTDISRHNFEIAISAPGYQNSLRQRRIATTRSEEVE